MLTTKPDKSRRFLPLNEIHVFKLTRYKYNRIIEYSLELIKFKRNRSLLFPQLLWIIQRKLQTSNVINSRGEKSTKPKRRYFFEGDSKSGRLAIPSIGRDDPFFRIKYIQKLASIGRSRWCVPKSIGKDHRDIDRRAGYEVFTQLLLVENPVTLGNCTST